MALVPPTTLPRGTTTSSERVALPLPVKDQLCGAPISEALGA